MDNEKTLPRISQLWSIAWQTYKKYYRELLLIALISGAPVILYVFCFVFLRQKGFVVIFSLLLYLMGMIFSIWGTAAFILFLNNPKISIENVFHVSWKYFFPLIWVQMLIGVLASAGLVFFLVPGIAAIGYFVFAQFLLVSEDARGMSALVASKNLVSGCWWSVFGRILALFAMIMLLLLLISAIMAALHIPEKIATVSISVVLLLMTSYIYTYLFAIYSQLTEIKKPKDYLCLYIKK